MLSIKLRKKNHDRLTKVVGYLSLVGYVAMLGFGIVKLTMDYQRTSSILANHTIIQAPLELDHVTESYHRRTGNRLTYHFRYAFEVDGAQYERTFGAVESNADKYFDRESVEVAFSNDTGEFDLMSNLRGNDSLPGLVWDIVKGMFILALMALLMFIYLTAMLFVVRPEDLETAEAEQSAENAKAPAV